MAETNTETPAPRTEREVIQAAPIAALVGEFDRRNDLLDQLLFSFDEWLGNSEGLMIEDVVEWRDLLASALGKPARG